KKILERFIDAAKNMFYPATVLELSYRLFQTRNRHAIEVANRLLERHKLLCERRGYQVSKKDEKRISEIKGGMA
ncbi:MAG: hypothetical protein ACE5GN_05760, partial [Waddliaceae bacterium]